MTFLKPSVIACCGAKEFDPQRVITDGFENEIQKLFMEDYEPLTLNLTLTLTQTLTLKPNSNPNPNPET